MSKFLIAGLGNPDPEHQHTRHNAGYDVAEIFVRNHQSKFKKDRFAEVAEVRWKGKIFIVIKPTTYMNLSGKAIHYWMEKEKVSLENLLVVVDDLALPIDKLRLRKSGSDAGHNGLKNIQEVLGTDVYPKLRFGIGSNFPKGRQVDFVLSLWLPQETPVVLNKMEKCTGVIENFATIGIERTMNLINNISFSVDQ